MKTSVYILLIFLILIGLIGSIINIDIDVEDLKYELNCERILKDKKIEELEKEIRIMKQDILILEYGCEYEEK